MVGRNEERKIRKSYFENNNNKNSKKKEAKNKQTSMYQNSNLKQWARTWEEKKIENWKRWKGDVDNPLRRLLTYI